MMHYYGYGRGWFFNPGFGFFELVISILFWILVISLIFSLFRSTNQTDEKNQITKPEDHLENNNMEIVKKRYAEGEIDKKEYEQLKRDLS